MGRLLDILTQLRWAAKCPQYYLLRLFAGPGSPREIRFHEKRSRKGLARILRAPLPAIDSWFREAEENDRLRTVEARVRELPYSGIFRGGRELYVLVRGSRPVSSVETGVGVGFSSAFILEALARNRAGNLVSIDLPNSDRGWKLPPGTEPGSLVPAPVRAQWDLRLGNTLALLPQVLRNLGAIDLFFHDSEHTYETMMFEYRAAYRALAPGGMLVSDDTMWNAAMLDFAKTERLAIEFVYHRGGGAPFALVRKPKRLRRSP